MENKVLLLDLPTFPKGTISLSLFCVAPFFEKEYETAYLDLNFQSDKDLLEKYDFISVVIVGIKVSSQNYQVAKAISERIKEKNSKTIILWGGELPSLLPDECLKYADTVISGLIEPVAELLLNDIKTNSLKKIYKGNNGPIADNPVPRFSLLKEFGRYNTFMGLPIETSRGCSERCTFCLVLVMQRQNYYLKSAEQLEKELSIYKGKFVNVVDYNFGVDKQHVISFSKLIKRSGCIGWMAEMNIELLDDDELLESLSDSNCKMIYCGLESIKESSLATVNKSETNTVANYERIIRKVQSYNIHVAAGLILGLDDMTEADYKKAYSFFSDMGTIYTKLTFLTFNPGTKIKERMAGQGDFLTEKIEYYDGNHITYMPRTMNKIHLEKITRWYIDNYYSVSGIVKRSFNSKVKLLSKIEMVLFAICYREAYLQWMKMGIFGYDDALFNAMLNVPYKKNVKVNIAEFFLNRIRLITQN